MVELRAFVGHSFTNDDEAVVGRFLKFFEQIAASHSNFSWQHAEAAEPRVLAEKVMSLIADKNVFIGICTKKERVAPYNVFTRSFFRSGLKVSEAQLLWKTSDWIIQEIGLAKGKGLELVLLIESGVRKPGGLQGDVEYIEFDRKSPEKSFGKILEMITALTPRAPVTTIGLTEKNPPPIESGVLPPSSFDWRAPKPEWTKRQHQIALMRSIGEDDESHVQSTSDSYLNSHDGAQPDSRESWLAFEKYIRLSFGKGGTLADLQGFAAANPQSSGAFAYLAKGFEFYKEYSRAGAAYESAARMASDRAEKVRLFGRAALSHARARVTDKATAVVEQMKEHAEKTEDGERHLLAALRDIYELRNEEIVMLAVLERLVEVDPGNADARFSLAYKHSQSGNNDLALLHYSRIPSLQRDAMTWNNLGVALDQFSLVAKAVDAQRTAEQMGETLAMSNLAGKFIDAGFLSEAQATCERALAFPGYNQNVGLMIAKLKQTPDEEERKETELLDKAEPKSQFYQNFGRAVCRREPTTLSALWRGPDCVLSFKVSGDKVSAEGFYERAIHTGLFQAIMGAGSGIAGTSSTPRTRINVKYEGTLGGHAIKAHVMRIRDGDTLGNSVSGSAENQTPVLMFLNDDESEILAMENFAANEPQFYVLHRV